MKSLYKCFYISSQIMKNLFWNSFFLFFRPLSKVFCISVSFIQSLMLRFSEQRNFFYLSWKLIERWTQRVPRANSKQRADLVKISMNDTSKIKIKIKNMYFWVFCNHDFVAAIVTNDFIVSGSYIRQTLTCLRTFAYPLLFF